MTYKTIELSGDDIVALESLLLDARARYLSEKTDVKNLYMAYGDKRDSISTRYTAAQQKIDAANRLLELIRE